MIDEIDALIDEQMRDGEPETGYDFNDPTFPECRCGLNWHGLPVRGCPGSDTEGPHRRGRRTKTVRLFQQTPTVLDREAVEAQLHAFRELGRAVVAEWERFTAAFSGLTAAVQALNLDVAQTVDCEDGRPALPIPARTPPMWAVDVTRTRRRRHL